MSCYTYNIILKLFIFGCLAITRMTTKLIESGLQDYRHMCYYFYVFYVFFQTFFAVFRTFSRTMVAAGKCM